MSAGVADLHKAVSSIWDSSGLDAAFKALWASGVDSSEFVSLQEQEAVPKQPWPYCVFDQKVGTTAARMSSTGSFIREIRDVPWDFRVFAKEISGDSRTAKKIAADLAEEIMKVFGGHPTDGPSALSLDNGNFLQAEYVNEASIRQGKNEHQWIVSYNFKLDVPMAV
jgi:hypothetical protein